MCGVLCVRGVVCDVSVFVSRVRFGNTTTTGPRTDFVAAAAAAVVAGAILCLDEDSSVNYVTNTQNEKWRTTVLSASSLITTHYYE